MDDNWLAVRFEQDRPTAAGSCLSMLGSLAEADDAVQDAWRRLNRSTANQVDNLGGRLTP